MSHETILVVDDEPAIIQVVRDRLAREGYEVLSARTGDEVIGLGQEPVSGSDVLDSKKEPAVAVVSVKCPFDPFPVLPAKS